MQYELPVALTVALPYALTVALPVASTVALSVALTVALPVASTVALSVVNRNPVLADSLHQISLSLNSCLYSPKSSASMILWVTAQLKLSFTTCNSSW